MSNLKFKITIAKLIELSINTNKKLAVKTIQGKGSFIITVDENGIVTLTGNSGVMTFKGDTILKEVGLVVKYVTVNFKSNDDNSVNYTANFKLGTGAFSGSIAFSGNINIEKLILKCSGLLCIAARALKNRKNVLEDHELLDIIE